MKLEYEQVHCVFSWAWDIGNVEDHGVTSSNGVVGGGGEADEVGAIGALGGNGRPSEADDDVCGICRASYNGTCPACKFPGDECPLVVGECNHNFHVHCIQQWLTTATARGLCPMCRQRFALKRGVRINAPHATRFEQLAQERDDDYMEE
ncbi:LAMI_0C07118g1_1 [Lachancea mirantina]|uniref:Anaphase-promoting complex subunit 11 n=1 Tax=Lachancea mirantina TaxID=1230905 RepID=A0A1G4J406_9SACH|nr:LAMI_0C07118g1_1 [Lachancea mirantina]